MAYPYELPITLGSSATGTVLRAQLYDGASGADVGGEISTGFTELGGGTFHWYYAMVDSHSGGVKIYENGSPTLPLVLGVVSPRETENADAKTSTRSVYTPASDTVEGALTYDELYKIVLAALAGKSTGGGTTSVAFRDVADGKDRIAATVTAAGNRTAITLDGS